jgi:transposase-like protein
MPEILCIFCHSIATIHGHSSSGARRYRCKNHACRRTFQLIHAAPYVANYHCEHCEGALVKNGFTYKRAQRYLCANKECSHRHVVIKKS